METVTTITGNKNKYTRNLPKVIILAKFKNMHELVLNRIKENTGLVFKENGSYYCEAQPTSSNQLLALLLTYDFKTEYQNNNSWENTLFLKFINNDEFRA